jgi:hypothetical protein
VTRACAHAVCLALDPVEQYARASMASDSTAGVTGSIVSRVGVPARPGSYRVITCRPAGWGEARSMQPAGRGDRPAGIKAEDLTHPLTAARPLARAATALACALAMASGLATAGCAGSPARKGHQLGRARRFRRLRYRG